MDVLVLYKHGQRSLRSAVRTSVLGDGLLERTRSTSLALLGATAAIGLAMVALALNQSWPLIAGAPIPGFKGEHQAVGKAAVVAKARSGRAAISAATSQASPGISSGKPSPHSGGTAALAGSQAAQNAGFVVAHPTPVNPAGGGPPGGATPNPAPVAQEPPPVATPAPAAVAVPVSSSTPSPPGPVSQNTPETPIPSETPPATDENDEHGHGHTGHGHGHSHSGDDSGTFEPNEDPETAPTPDETTPPEADVPDESDGGQSHAPSWGHGGSHGHGRW